MAGFSGGGRVPGDPAKLPRTGFILAAPWFFAAQGIISESDYKDLLFWGAMLVIGMLLLFILQRVIRFGIQSKVRSIHREIGMRPDDLDRMTRSGLLSEEERKRIQESIARSLSKESEEALRRTAEGKKSAEEILSASLAPLPSARERPSLKRPPVGPRTQDEPFPPPEAGEGKSSSRRPDGSPTVDLDSLLARGLITPEEFRRLQESKDDA